MEENTTKMEFTHPTNYEQHFNFSSRMIRWQYKTGVRSGEVRSGVGARAATGARVGVGVRAGTGARVGVRVRAGVGAREGADQVSDRLATMVSTGEVSGELEVKVANFTDYDLGRERACQHCKVRSGGEYHRTIRSSLAPRYIKILVVVKYWLADLELSL